MKHRKALTIIIYVMAALFYLAAVYEFCVGNTSQGIVGLVLGSFEMWIANSNIASPR